MPRNLLVLSLLELVQSFRGSPIQTVNSSLHLLSGKRFWVKCLAWLTVQRYAWEGAAPKPNPKQTCDWFRPKRAQDLPRLLAGLTRIQAGTRTKISLELVLPSLNPNMNLPLPETRPEIERFRKRRHAFKWELALSPPEPSQMCSWHRSCGRNWIRTD